MVLSTRCYLVLHMRYNNVLMVTTLSILSLTHSLTASQLQRPLFPLSLVLCSDLCRRHRNRVAKPPHRHAAPAFHLNKKTQLAVLERPTSGCLSGAEHQAAVLPVLKRKDAPPTADALRLQHEANGVAGSVRLPVSSCACVWDVATIWTACVWGDVQ